MIDDHLQCEAAVVSSLLTWPSVADVVLEQLPLEDMLHPAFRRVYRAIQDRHRRGETWDIALLQADGVPLSAITDALSAGTAFPEVVEAHVRVIRLAAMRRRAAMTARLLAEQLGNPDSDPEMVVAEAVGKLQDCRVDVDEFTHVGQHLEAWMTAVKANLETPTAERRARGIPTGLKLINEKLTFGGLPRGHMSIVAGQSSGGKTSFAVSALAVPAALSGFRVGVCTLEDSALSVAVRAIADLANLPNRQLQREEVANIVEWQEASQQAMRLNATNLWLYDQPPASVDALCARINRHVADRGCDMVIIDFLQYVPSGRREGNKTEREEYTLRQLALMARRLHDTATVVLSQYRDIPPTQRPTDNDIRGAKVARHFAHTIMHVWATPQQEAGKHKTIIVSKQKQGPTGDVEVGWEKTRVRFFDAP